jgi:uncharacterized protein (TIGR00297 family)
MFRLFTLDSKGILLAVAMGALILFLGGADGLLFLSDLLLFLVLSAAVTRIGKIKKLGIGVYEHVRSWRNVLANGAVPTAAALLYWLNSWHPFVTPGILVLAYVASVCAVTADKFGSELGVLDGEPTMLLTLKRTKKGVSGGVTGIGLLSSLVGSAIIGLSALLFGGGLAGVAIVTLAGFLGSIVDSILGYFEENGIGNKFTSNFFCSVTGLLACLFMLLW